MPGPVTRRLMEIEMGTPEEREKALRKTQEEKDADASKFEEEKEEGDQTSH